VSAADALAGLVMLLVMWGLCFLTLRLGRWWFDWCDRRDMAVFREQVLLAEAEMERRRKAGVL
jgi:hypothetical protein